MKNFLWSILAWRQGGRQLAIKTCTLIITISFLFPIMSWAFEPGLYTAGQQPLMIHHLGRAVTVPEKWAHIESAFQGGNKTVICIQDLHCNYEVQKNIAATLKHLIKTQGLHLVAIEGASGPVNPSLLRNFPLKRIRNVVSDYLVKEGRLSGADYVAVTSQAPVKLEGIESQALYEESLKTVRQFLNSETQGLIYDLREALGTLKASLYSPELKRLDQIREKYRDGHLDILGYAAKLDGQARRQRLDLNNYPQVRQFLKWNQTYFGPQTNPEKLYQELDHLDQALRIRLYTTDLEKQLDEHLRRLDNMEKLLNISATQQELADFRGHRGDYRTQSFLDFINATSPKNMSPLPLELNLLSLDQALDEVWKFYHLADERSVQFVDNLLSAMQTQQQSLAVMINGGFHTEQVSEELRKRNITYLLVRPQVSRLDVVNPYFELLQNRRTPLEQLLAKNQTILAVADQLQALAVNKLKRMAWGTLLFSTASAEAMKVSAQQALSFDITQWQELKAPVKGVRAFLAKVGEAEKIVVVANRPLQAYGLEPGAEVVLKALPGQHYAAVFADQSAYEKINLHAPSAFLESLSRVLQQAWVTMKIKLQGPLPALSPASLLMAGTTGFLPHIPLWESPLAGGLTSQATWTAAILLALIILVKWVLPRRPKAKLSEKQSPSQFYTKDGYDLALYVSLIKHLRDLPAEKQRAYRERFIKALETSQPKEGIGPVFVDLARECMAEGFPLEPERLDTLMKRQSTTADQALVELINNGFDAMGDAIGRFGRGVYQAIGLLQNEGDRLEFITIPDKERRTRYKAVFVKTRGTIRVNFYHESLLATQGPGTEVVLHRQQPLDGKRLENYIRKKLGTSRRGLIFQGKSGQVLVNDLSPFDQAGQPVTYRLGEKAVRYWLSEDGRELHVRDSGKGVAPFDEGRGLSTLMEALPVPEVSTNRTGDQLKSALLQEDWTANGEEYYWSRHVGKTSKVYLLVGGTEVETLEIEGAALAQEVVIDLPTACDQREGRQQILLDEVTARAFQTVADNLLRNFSNNPESMMPVVNAVYLAAERLQQSQRTKTKGEELNIARHLRQRFYQAASRLKEMDYVFLPAMEQQAIAPEAYAGKKPLTVEEGLLPFDPRGIDAQPVLSSGKSVWIANLTRPFARVGKLLLLNQAIYYAYVDKALAGQGPLLLNLLFGVWTGYGTKPGTEATLHAGGSVPRGVADASPAGMTFKFDDYPVNIRQLLQFNYFRSGRTGLAPKAAERLSKIDDFCAVHGFSIADAFKTELAGESYDVAEIDGDLFLRMQRGIVYDLYRWTGSAFSELTEFHGLDVIQMPEKVGEDILVGAGEPGSMSLYQWSGRRFEVVPDLKPAQIIYPIGQAGGKTYVAVRQGAEDIIYRRSHGRFEVVQELRRLNLKEGPIQIGEEVFFIGSSDHHSYLFRLANGRFELTQGLADAREIGIPVSAGGQIYVNLTSLSDDSQHFYRLTDGRFVEIVELKDKDGYGTPVEVGGETYEIAGPANDARLYRLVQGRFVQVQELAEVAFTYHDKPVAVGQEIYILGALTNGETRLYRLIHDRFEPVKELGEMEKATNPVQVGSEIYMWLKHRRHWSLFHLSDGYFTHVENMSNIPDAWNPFSIGGVNYAIIGEWGVKRLFRLEGSTAIFTGLEGEFIDLLKSDLVIFKQNQTITIQPLDWFKNIADGPFIEPSDEFYNHLSPEAKSRFINNLLHYNWSAADMEKLDWLLPFADGQEIKRLNPQNQETLSKICGRLFRQHHRAVGQLLDGLGQVVSDNLYFNQVLDRWLHVIAAGEAGEDRGFEMITGLQSHWEWLSPETGPDEIAEGAFLIRYLRGDVDMEDLSPRQLNLPRGRSLDVIKKIRLSVLAGVRRNLGIFQSVAALKQTLKGNEAYAQTEEDIARGGMGKGYEWIRENIQNADKASLEKGGAQRIEVTAVPVQTKGKTQLVLSTRDYGIGMDTEDMLNFLLPLDRTGAKEGADPSKGYYGRGWYKNLTVADRVRVISGKSGSGRFQILEVRKIPNGQGGFTWEVERFAEFEGQFEGTRVDTWIKEYPGDYEQNQDGIDLETAIIGDSLQLYAGTLGSVDEKRRLTITFNGRNISEQAALLAEVDWQDQEKIKVVKRASGKTGVLQAGYFVMDLNQYPELWALVPAALKDMLKTQGLSLSLPVSLKQHVYSIVTDRERGGLAETEKYLPRLQKAILAAVLETAAATLNYDRPLDLVYKYDHLVRHYISTETLAGKLNQGRWEDLTDREVQFIQNSDQLTTLLTRIKVQQPGEGKKLSLYDLHCMAVEADRRDSPVDLKELSEPFALLLKEAQKPQHQGFGQVTIEDDRPTPLRESELTAAHHALAKLCQDLMQPLMQTHGYGPYKVGFMTVSTKRIAFYGPDWINFNQNSIGDWLAWMNRFMNHQSTTQEDYAKLYDIMETLVHENAHLREGHGEETHNERFNEIQRQLILEMINARLEPEQVLLALRQDPDLAAAFSSGAVEPEKESPRLTSPKIKAWVHKFTFGRLSDKVELDIAEQIENMMLFTLLGATMAPAIIAVVLGVGTGWFLAALAASLALAYGVYDLAIKPLFAFLHTTIWDETEHKEVPASSDQTEQIRLNFIKITVSLGLSAVVGLTVLMLAPHHILATSLTGSAVYLAGAITHHALYRKLFPYQKFISPARAGLRNVVATIDYLFHWRSQEDMGIMDLILMKKVVDFHKLMGFKAMMMESLFWPPIGNSPYAYESEEMKDPKFINLPWVFNHVYAPRAVGKLVFNYDAVKKWRQAERAQYDQKRALTLEVLQSVWQALAAYPDNEKNQHLRQAFETYWKKEKKNKEDDLLYHLLKQEFMAKEVARWEKDGQYLDGETLQLEVLQTWSKNNRKAMPATRERQLVLAEKRRQENSDFQALYNQRRHELKEKAEQEGKTVYELDDLRDWAWQRWKGDICEAGEEGLWAREPASLRHAKKRLADQILFQAFVQFIADAQYDELKTYARSKGIELAVDKGIAPSEADPWKHPAWYGLKKKLGFLRLVSRGVPAEEAYPNAQYWQMYLSESMDALKAQIKAMAKYGRYIRIDHALALFRSYYFTEGDVTWKDLGIFKEMMAIRQEAMAAISAAADNEEQERLRQAAADKAQALYMDKLKQWRRQLPANLENQLPADALHWLMNEHGRIGPDNAIYIARTVPRQDYDKALPEDSPWRREYQSVEQKIKHDARVQDYLRTTPADAIKGKKGHEQSAQGFWKTYFFDMDPKESDRLQFGYFKPTPHSATLLAELERYAKALGVTLVYETLGVVPHQAQTEMETSGAYGFAPYIFALTGEPWGDRLNPYYPDHMPSRMLATGALHDSVTFSAMWAAMNGESKQKVIDDFKTDGFEGLDGELHDLDSPEVAEQVHGAYLWRLLSSRAGLALLSASDFLTCRLNSVSMTPMPMPENLTFVCLTISPWNGSMRSWEVKIAGHEKKLNYFKS